MRFVSPCGAVFDILPDSFACDPPHSVENALVELTLRTPTLGNQRFPRPAPMTPLASPPRRPSVARTLNVDLKLTISTAKAEVR